MDIIESFKQNYNKVHHYVSENPNSCVVKELEDEATFKAIVLDNPNSIFFDFDKKIYKNWGTWKNQVSAVRDRDCDGVIMQRKINQKDCLFCVELKSRFDTDELFKAHEQVIVSLFKMYTMFSICDGFDWENIDVHFILGCHPFEDKVQESSVYSFLEQEIMLRPNGFFSIVLNEIIHNSPVTYKIGQLPVAKKFALPDSIKSKEITYSWVHSDSYTDSQVILNL